LDAKEGSVILALRRNLEKCDTE